MGFDLLEDKKRMKNKKGQMTVQGLITIFVTILVYAILYPMISSVIDNFINASTDPWLNMTISLVPLLMLLTIIITMFMYVSPQRPEY